MASKKKKAARPGRRRNPDEVASERLTVRYTTPELEGLRRWAKSCKPPKTVSELVREVTLARQRELFK